MDARSIFFEDSNRLRSGWRAAIFLALFIAAGILLGGSAQVLLASLQVSGSNRSLIFMTVNGAVSLIPALLIGWLCGKLLEHLPFRALGASLSNNWFRNLMYGVAIGALSLSVAVGIAAIFGGLRFHPDAGTDPSSILAAAAASLLVFAIAAAFEEALFRGYILQTFARSGLAWFAIAITAVFFGFLHLGNPDAGWISTANTMLAGVWFGIAYLKTRDLWFPFGIHLMWNWMQGAVFGIEVSGLTEVTTAPLLREIDHGPVWLTGENYGIEGGLAATAALIISTLAIYYIPFIRPTEEMAALTSPATDREAVTPSES